MSYCQGCADAQAQREVAEARLAEAEADRGRLRKVLGTLVGLVDQHNAGRGEFPIATNTLVIARGLLRPAAPVAPPEAPDASLRAAVGEFLAARDEVEREAERAAGTPGWSSGPVVRMIRAEAVLRRLVDPTRPPLDLLPLAPLPGSAVADALGRLVRDAWVAWAKTQPNPKPSWLVPWDDLDEVSRDADRWIGMHLVRVLSAADPEAPDALPVEVRAVIDAAERWADSWARCAEWSTEKDLAEAVAARRSSRKETGADLPGDPVARWRRASRAEAPTGESGDG